MPFKLLISRPDTGLDFLEREEDCPHRRAAEGYLSRSSSLRGIAVRLGARATDAAQRPRDQIDLVSGSIEFNTLLGPAQPPGMFWR